MPTPGQELRRLVVHSAAVDGAVEAVGFSRDGKRFITASRDRTAWIFDADTGTEIRRFGIGLGFVLDAAKSTSDVGHTDKVWAASFSPDRKRIITAGEDATARIWDADTGRQLSVHGRLGPMKVAMFSPDGKWFVTACQDINGARAEIWDAETCREIRALTGHGAEIIAAGCSPDSKRIVTASKDKTTRIWDTVTGQELFRLISHTDVVAAVAFSPDGKRIVTGSYDRTARIWDANTGQELVQLTGHTAALGAAGLSRDGKRIVTGSRDKAGANLGRRHWPGNPQIHRAHGRNSCSRILPGRQADRHRES